MLVVERSEVGKGQAWEVLAAPSTSHSFPWCWVALLTLGIFEDCWYEAQQDALCFQNFLLESNTLLELKVIFSLN